MDTIKGIIGAFWDLVLRNPVYFQGLVVAGVALGSAFGLSWTGAQVGAVTAFTAALLSFLTQTAVTPLANPTLPADTVVNVTTPTGQPDRTVTV